MSSMYSWKNKSVFVTGATGFLGTWLIEDLLRRDANVVCLERDVTPDSLFYLKRLHKKVTVVYGDLCSYQSMLRVLNEYDINTVFHLGAQTLVGYANRSPLSTFHSNIEGTWNLLEACRQSPWIKKIVVASSDKAYGDQALLPYTEETPLQGKHPYDVSKSCTDLIAQSYFYTYNLPVCITRCGNIFGGGDFHYSRIIPGTVKSLFNNERPIIRSNGLSVRDYVYVEDIVHGYLSLAEHMDNDQLWGHAFNLSEEKPLTVLDVVKEITLQMSKENLKPIISDKASGEIKDQHLSCKKAENAFGWKPLYGFDQGIEKTIKWYLDYFAIDELYFREKEVSVSL